MHLSDIQVRSRRLPGAGTWWRRVICFAVLAATMFAALAGPIITFHPHIDPHAVEAHHAGPIAPEERKIVSVLEAICLSMDGCHQMGSWLDLAASRHQLPVIGARSFPGTDAPFTSVLLAGPLRPPNPFVAAPSDERVSASSCEVA